MFHLAKDVNKPTIVFIYWWQLAATGVLDSFLPPLLLFPSSKQGSSMSIPCCGAGSPSPEISSSYSFLLPTHSKLEVDPEGEGSIEVAENWALRKHVMLPLPHQAMVHGA